MPAKYDAKNFRWFGNSLLAVPEEMEGTCASCGFYSSNKPSKSFIFIICPECKKKAFVVSDAARWGYYFDFDLHDWQFFTDQYGTPMGFSTEQGRNFMVGSDRMEGVFRAKYPLYNEKKLSTFLHYAKSLCFSGGITKTLDYRLSARLEGICIDTGGQSHIQITEAGWKRVPPYDFFRKYDHMKEFVCADAGTREDFDAYIRLMNIPSEQKILIETWLISTLIPNIPHPLLIPTGSQGAAKSTMGSLARSLIDPSALSLLSIPLNEAEFLQQLQENYLVVYDNIQELTDEQADVVCRAITGQSFSKRKLYTDGDSYYRTFRSIIILNGINLPSARPDVLDRAITFDLLRIPEEDRKTAVYIFSKAEEVAPRARAFMLDIVSRILPKISSVASEMQGRLPRMADWAIVSEAIARELGYHSFEFLDKYKALGREQTEQVLEADIISDAIMEIAEEGFEGKSTELLVLLKDRLMAKGQNPDRMPKFPKTGNSLSRHLKTLQASLAEKKYSVERINDGSSRKIKIGKRKEKEGQQGLEV